MAGRRFRLAQHASSNSCVKPDGQLGPRRGEVTLLGPVEYVSWLAVISVEICSIVFILKSGALKKYFTLLLYLSACLANSVGCYSIIQTSGYTSEAYSYYYYLSLIHI